MATRVTWAHETWDMRHIQILLKQLLKDKNISKIFLFVGKFSPESEDWTHTWLTDGRAAPWPSRTLTARSRPGSPPARWGTSPPLDCESWASTWEEPWPPAHEQQSVWVSTVQHSKIRWSERESYRLRESAVLLQELNHTIRQLEREDTRAD